MSRAAGSRGSRQTQQRAGPWSLHSLKRALAEQRRGSIAPSSRSFDVRSSSCVSMLLDGEGEDAEVLDTIYANWGDIDQGPSAGEPTHQWCQRAVASDPVSVSLLLLQNMMFSARCLCRSCQTGLKLTAVSIL